MATPPQIAVTYKEFFNVNGATTSTANGTNTRTITVKALPTGLTNTNANLYRLWLGPAATAQAVPFTVNTTTKTLTILSTYPAVTFTTTTPIWIGRPFEATAGMSQFYLRAAVIIPGNSLIRFSNDTTQYRSVSTGTTATNLVKLSSSVPSGFAGGSRFAVSIGGLGTTAQETITFGLSIAQPVTVRETLAIQNDNPLLAPYAGPVNAGGLPVQPYLSSYPLGSTSNAKAALVASRPIDVIVGTAHATGYVDVYNGTMSAYTNVDNYTRTFTRAYYSFYNDNVIAAYNMQEKVTAGVVAQTRLSNYISYTPAIFGVVYDASSTSGLLSSAAVDYYVDPSTNVASTYGYWYSNANFALVPKNSPSKYTPAVPATVKGSYVINDTIAFSGSISATPYYPPKVYTAYTNDTLSFIDAATGRSKLQRVYTSDSVRVVDHAEASGVTKIVNVTNSISLTDQAVLPLLKFTTPTTKVVPPYNADTRGPAFMLFRHYAPTERHVNVFQLSDGTYVQDYPTPENSNANVPYPWITDSPDNRYAFVTYFNGTTEAFTLNPHIKQVFWGGEVSLITQETANQMIREHPLYKNYLEPANA